MINDVKDCNETAWGLDASHRDAAGEQTNKRTSPDSLTNNVIITFNAVNEKSKHDSCVFDYDVTLNIIKVLTLREQGSKAKLLI